jgi:hypothetical protein
MFIRPNVVDNCIRAFIFEKTLRAPTKLKVYAITTAKK